MTGRTRLYWLAAATALAALAFWFTTAPPGLFGPQPATPDAPSPIPLATAAPTEVPDLIDVSDDGTVSARKALPGVQAPYRLARSTVEPGSTVARTLQNLGMTASMVASLTAGVKPAYNLARVAAGTPVAVGWKDATDASPLRVELKLSETKTLVAWNEDAGWRPEFREEVVTRSPAAYSGVVTSNLWSSAAMAGMDPQLIQKLAEVFAWQIDFNREVQLNDRWRLTVEQLFVRGKPIGFGEILAAEYENVGVVFTALRHDVAGRPQYFTPAGESLRRMFLKSPLKFGRITSGFTSRRFHPVLKVNRPHNGVDYGAPTGTPVMSVGNGTVTFAANKGASGNMVRVRHNGVYDTEYKHLSGFAAGIRSGARVEMGQVIGYVGATGLATGPHLHFELHENGRYVDPQGIKFPAADPVPVEERDAYKAKAQTLLTELPPWSEAVLSRQTDREKDDTARRNE